MKCVQLLLVFAFIFPTFINAEKVKCQTASACHITKTTDLLSMTDNGIECEDACLYYKCVIPGRMILEGAGCYNDFNTYCDYTRSEIKNQVFGNLTRPSFSYSDSTAMVVTCRDKDNCAKDAFEKLMKSGENEKNFAASLDDAYFDTRKRESGCAYGRTRDINETLAPKGFYGTVQCPRREWCETGKNFDIKYRGYDVQSRGIKNCDACMFYRCTEDNGRNVISGFGCFEDFDRACPSVSSEVKISVKENIKTSFHFGDSSYIVSTCSHKDYCFNDKSSEYERFMDVHPFAKIKVDATVDGTCQPPVLTGSLSVSTSFSPSHQINAWMLFGFIFAGFFYHMA